MSTEEGSLHEIRGALSLITRRLEELAAAVARLEPPSPAPAEPGALLDEATRSGLAPLESLLAVGAATTPAEALLLVVDRAIHRAGADCAAVFLLTPEGELGAASHRGFTPRAPRVRAGEGIVGRALLEREIVRGGSVDHDRDPLLREHGLGSALAIPIRPPAEAPVGVLFSGRRRGVEFDGDALEVLTLLAERLALALRAPIRTGEPETEAQDLEADLDLGRTAAVTARRAAAVLGASAVALFLPDEGGLTLGAGVGLPVGAAPLGSDTRALEIALRTREPWTAAEGPPDDILAGFLGAPPQLVVPIVAGDGVVALLAAGGSRRMAPTTLAALLPRAAIALRNARLHTETVAALSELRLGEGRDPVPAPAPARDYANLLAVVLGRLAVVRERVADAAVTRELDVAEEAAWRAAEAVRALLGFAPGHRADTLAPLDVGGVIRTTVEHARARWAARDATPPMVRLELEPVPPVRGSVQDLREALDHLLENAAEAGPAGGLITVRARWEGGPRVEIAVEDRGVGMDDAVRARALEPFFSTKGRGRLGLGLPVAQAIVARHRGELEIASALGLGTTVRLTLPTMSGGASGRRGEAGAALPVARVLVVEDEAVVREALVAAVVQQGHVALTASDAPEALALIRREPFEAVITDLMLPGGSGLEVARAVRRLRPETPVILVTGWPGRLDAGPLEESGIEAVIEKPVGLAEIGAALATALTRRGARRA